MIRIRYVSLPAGLSACVLRSASGDIEVFVATGLDPARARAAVRLALRAYGPRRWQAALPVALLFLLTGRTTWLRGLVRLPRAHAIGAAAAAAGVGMAAATSAVLIMSTVPQHHGRGAVAAPRPVPAQAPPAGRRSGQPSPAASRQTSPPARTARPAAAHRPQPGPPPSSSAAPTATPSASVRPSASVLPSASPSSSSSGGGSCLRLLVIRICL